MVYGRVSQAVRSNSGLYYSNSIDDWTDDGLVIEQIDSTRQPDTSKIHVKLREISVIFLFCWLSTRLSLSSSALAYTSLSSSSHLLSLRFPSLLVFAISISNCYDTTIASLKSPFETQNPFISLMWGLRMHKGTTGNDSSTITLCFAFYVFRVLVLGVFHVQFVTCPTQSF